MKTLKTLLVITAVVGLVVLGLNQYKFVKADENNNKGGENENHGLLINNENENKGHNAENESENESEQGKLQFSIQPNGKVNLRGASVVSNSGNSFSAKIFGLNLNVAIVSSTELIGIGPETSSTTANIKAGDTVDVQGAIDSDSGVITADQVRDRTLQEQNIQSIQQQIQALLEQVKKLQEQLRGQTNH